MNKNLGAFYLFAAVVALAAFCAVARIEIPVESQSRGPEVLTREVNDFVTRSERQDDPVATDKLDDPRLTKEEIEKLRAYLALGELVVYWISLADDIVQELSDPERLNDHDG